MKPGELYKLEEEEKEEKEEEEEEEEEEHSLKQWRERVHYMIDLTAFHHQKCL